VPGCVLSGGTNVDHDDVAGSNALGELGATDLLQLRPVTEVGASERVDVFVVGRGDVAYRRPQIADTGRGKAVEDPGAVTSGRHQTGRGEPPEMERCGRNALADLGGELVDVTFSLREHVDQFGTATVAEPFGDGRERVEQLILRLPIAHTNLLIDSLDKLANGSPVFKGLLEELAMDGTRMFVDEGLGHSSYLIDLGDGSAAILDPPRFAADHVAAARTSGLTPRWTIDTHSHADYVTGSPALVTDSELTFIAPAASKVDTPHRPVHDGERIVLAPGVALRAIATPGHTPDHHVYVLEREGVPVALFSGGSLMVGAIGRTDLCGPALAEPLAHDMFHSLRRLAELPDDLAVYPTHGAGSFCSAPGSAERTSTLGRERAANALLRIDDEDSFVERLLAGFGSFPSYFARLPEINRRGPRHYPGIPQLDRLDIDAVERHVANGALIVDARSLAEFAAEHIAGSISNALRPVFASWLGWITDLDRPVVIVAGAGQDRDEIVRQCLDVGHDSIAGELDGGVDAWRASGRETSSIPLVSPSGIVPTVIDVRQRSEYETGHVPGAVNIELGSLTDSAVPDGPVTVMCGHGERAMTGASILTSRGHRNVTVLDGGPDTWAAWSGKPLALE
jgi:hydroxyacylglutathione hydrolase